MKFLAHIFSLNSMVFSTLTYFSCSEILGVAIVIILTSHNPSIVNSLRCCVYSSLNRRNSYYWSLLLRGGK